MEPIYSTLEAEYNNRALVPEHPAIFERWRRASSILRANAPCTLDLAYGAAAHHKLDLFHAINPHGTVVFIHGGYWRSLDKSDFSFVAKPFLDAGLCDVALNYRLCPSVLISDVVEDCRQAIAWIVTKGPAHQLPMERVVLAGHSAGGHLVAMLYATDWRQRQCDVSCIIGGIALSGVYDLQPLIHCSMNADLRLDQHSARAASPINLESTLAIPLHLTVGAAESAAFRAQSQLLCAAWPTICATPEEVANANHFTVVDHLAQPAHQTCLRVLRFFR